MVEDALQWFMVDETYLEVLDYLGAALVDLSGGVMDFNTVDALEEVLETGLTLVLVNVKCLGGEGAGALREPFDSNRSFPVTSTYNIVLAALETLGHMLDFKSSMSCLGFG